MFEAWNELKQAKEQRNRVYRGGGRDKETRPGEAMGVLDLESAGQYVWNSPRMYLQWWLNLVNEDPGHVIVETALIAFIVYIMIFKKTLNPKVGWLVRSLVGWLVGLVVLRPILLSCTSRPD